MKERGLQVLILFIFLVSLTAGLLVRVRANYLLGKPGVKIVNAPVYDEKNNIVAGQRVYLPERVEDCVSSNAPVSSVELHWLPPDTIYGRKIYHALDHFELMTSVVLMGTDRTSIHKPQYCLTGQGQTIVGSEVITIPIAKPRPYELKVMKLSTVSQRSIGGGKFVPVSGIFLYWFVADGQLTPYHGERMWLMGRDLLTKGLLQRWAYVAYFSVCAPGQEQALLARMKRFVSESVPEFQVTSPSAVAGRWDPSASSVELAFEP
jgi:hypothetical protein